MTDFLGQTYSDARDHGRLSAQLDRVRATLKDGAWHTLAELEDRLGYPQASISARLRDCRRPEHGGYTIEREYVMRGLWRYRMVLGQASLPFTPPAVEARAV